MSTFDVNAPYMTGTGVTHSCCLRRQDPVCVPVQAVGPPVFVQACLDGREVIGTGLGPVAPRLLEALADKLSARAFDHAGADLHASPDILALVHAVLVVPVAVDAGSHILAPVPEWLKPGNDLVHAPGLRFVPDFLDAPSARSGPQPAP